MVSPGHLASSIHARSSSISEYIVGSDRDVLSESANVDERMFEALAAEDTIRKTLICSTSQPFAPSLTWCNVREILNEASPMKAKKGEAITMKAHTWPLPRKPAS